MAQIEWENTGKAPTPIYKKHIVCVGAIVLIVIMIIIAIALMSVGGGEKEIKVIYSGSWSGSIGDEDGSKSVDGSGTETFTVDGSIITAVIQKSDDSSGRLTVQILSNGEVVEEESTTAAYGVVSVSHSF